MTELHRDPRNDKNEVRLARHRAVETAAPGMDSEAPQADRDAWLAANADWLRSDGDDADEAHRAWQAMGSPVPGNLDEAMRLSREVNAAVARVRSNPRTRRAG